MKKRTKRIILACTVLIPYWIVLFGCMCLVSPLTFFFGFIGGLPSGFKYLFVELDEDDKQFELNMLQTSGMFCIFPLMIIGFIKEYINTGEIGF